MGHRRCRGLSWAEIVKVIDACEVDSCRNHRGRSAKPSQRGPRLKTPWRITDVANETEKDPWFPPLGVVWLQPASAVRPTHGGEPGEWTMNGGMDSWRRDGSRKTLPASLQCFLGFLGDDRGWPQPQPRTFAQHPLTVRDKGGRPPVSSPPLDGLFAILELPFSVE